MQWKAVLPLTALLLLLAASGTVSAAEFTISDVEVSPDPPVTGESATFTVTFENTGNGQLEFVKESRLKLYVGDEMESQSSLLVKPNYTDPPEYLKAEPGETAEWELEAVRSVTGEEPVRVVYEGPYEYDGVRSPSAVRIAWEDRLEFVNPEVEGFDIWVTSYDWGIKPSVIVSNGRAYTGDAQLEITHNGSSVFRKDVELQGENEFAVRAPYDEFFSGNGTYSVEVGFEGESASKAIKITDPGSAPEEVAEEGETGGEDGGSDAGGVPGYGPVLALLAAGWVALRR